MFTSLSTDSLTVRGYFCPFLLSNINCLPLFLQIRSQSGVISVHSCYLTSIVYLSFYRFARPRFLLFSSLRNTVAQPVSFCTQRFGAPSYMRHCLLERSFSLAEMLFLWQRVGFRCRARASLRCCSFADHCRHGLHRLEPLTSGKDLMHVTHPLVWGSDI